MVMFDWELLERIDRFSTLSLSFEMVERFVLLSLSHISAQTLLTSDCRLAGSMLRFSLVFSAEVDVSLIDLSLFQCA